MRYDKSTEGIRVRVRPRYSLADSDPADGMFVFAYTVTMANESEDTAQLLFRHWRIHDAAGDDSTVDGEGVIGEQLRSELDLLGKKGIPVDVVFRQGLDVLGLN